MNPDAIELNRRGAALGREGRLAEAAECLRQAVAAEPLFGAAHANLGHALDLLGDLPAAAMHLQRANDLDPGHVELLNKLGVVYARLMDYGRAEACLRRAVELRPEHAGALNNLGIALAKLERFREAADVFRRAAALEPDSAGAHANLGGSLVWLDAYDEAEAALQKALRLNPQHADAQANLGLLRKEQGRIEDALAHYEQALQAKPDSAEAHKNRALSLFLKGEFEAGWADYEWRIKLGDTRVVHVAPQWDGSPLKGRTILLEAEQGMGDTIQFVRYAAEIQGLHNARVILACEPQLMRLLTGVPGVDVLISQNDPRPAFDVWSPLMSLPGAFRHGLATFPANVPYLKPESDRVERWRERLSAIDGLRANDAFKIGIAWQGNRQRRNDHKRSFPSSALAPLAAIPGVRLISLQKGTAEASANDAGGVAVVSLGGDFDRDAPFLDTAAVMQSLDLVVSADTSVAHVAGALGVPVWLALAKIPDWRWTMFGERTPWYPTMRLFRQKRPGDWAGVFTEIASALPSTRSGP